MKATIECKENCITLKTKHESETLYDTEIAEMFGKIDTLELFVDEVYDYFDNALEDVEINYKELQQVCKKVYKNLK